MPRSVRPAPAIDHICQHYSTAANAVKAIKSDDRVFIHGVAAAPAKLIEAMVGRASELKNVEIVHLHTEGEAPYARAEYSDSFHVNAFFVGSNVRQAINDGRGDYIPVFLVRNSRFVSKRCLAAKCRIDPCIAAG